MVTWRIPQSSLFSLRLGHLAPDRKVLGSNLAPDPNLMETSQLIFSHPLKDQNTPIKIWIFLKKKNGWITQIFGLRISFLYTPGALWSWNLHVDRALGVMDNAVWAGGVTSGVDSHIGPHWQNFFLQFCECGLQGIRDALTAFRLSLLTSEKFSFENLLSNPCQVSWAEFTLSGPVFY